MTVEEIPVEPCPACGLNPRCAVDCGVPHAGCPRFGIERERNLDTARTWVDWNPRFVAYAQAHGHDPDEQLAADAEAYPGGIMGGFILWMAEQWAAWRAERNRPKRTAQGWTDHPTEQDHADFTAWLTARVCASSSAGVS